MSARSPEALRIAGRRLAAALLAACALSAGAQQKVQFPSLDGPAAAPVMLSGLFFRGAPVVGGSRGAVLMLHGCSGLWRDESRNALQPRYAEYLRLFVDEGWHVLLVDSLSPRGLHEVCTQKLAARALRPVGRRRDVLAALQWLAEQDGVDPARLALVGWSHGGSATLSALNLRHAEVVAAPRRPRAAVVFYPGCGDELRVGFDPSAPLLMLLGEADDWTPATTCLQLAQAATVEPAAALELHAYPGAHHDFDSEAPLRLRRDVPNGANPGQGVHLGGDPRARADARRRLLEFLRDQFR